MKRTAHVTLSVDVEIDETKFTDQFLKEFKENFYDLDTVEDHIAYLAQLAVRGYSFYDDRVIEGYGTAPEIGLKVSPVDHLDTDLFKCL